MCWFREHLHDRFAARNSSGSYSPLQPLQSVVQLILCLVYRIWKIALKHSICRTAFFQTKFNVPTLPSICRCEFVWNLHHLPPRISPILQNTQWDVEMFWDGGHKWRSASIRKFCNFTAHFEVDSDVVCWDFLFPSFARNSWEVLEISNTR